jgi:hypothetical protein
LRKNQFLNVATSYESLVYRQPPNGLESGDIFGRDSVRFRSINDDLLDERLWRSDKEALIAKAGLDILRQPIDEHLAELERRLEMRLAEVNQRIAASENPHFKLKENGRRTREYHSDDEETNHPFFDQLPPTDINSVLRFAGRQCRFMDAFTYIDCPSLRQHVQKALNRGEN